jgi:hypothetical protein
MSTINRLALQDTVNTGLQLAVYSPENGDARRLPVGALLTFFQQQYVHPDFAVNLFTPGTGFSISLNNVSQWVCIQPAGTLATGTITLPLSPTDGTEILITTTQQITALTIGLNGAVAIYGEPSTLGAEDKFRLRYLAQTSSWYCIA